MISELARGTHGITLALPSTLEIVDDREQMATLIDREQAIQWHFFFATGYQLDLSQPVSLRRDVSAHAEYLFEFVRRVNEVETPKPLRHPLVTCERVVVDGAPALSVIHRMAMEPGTELVMTHLLVPVPKGLFEARWLTRNASSTGMRETALLMKAMQDQPGVDPDELVQQLAFDSDEHDEMFPDHPLTVARVADRWLRSALRVAAPAPPVPAGEVTLAIGVTLVPPPRFALSVDDEFARFGRVSLATTDGVQTLIIEPAEVGSVEDFCSVMVEQGGAYRLHSLRGIPAALPLVALAVGDGENESKERIRVVVARWFVGERGFQAVLITTPAQPEAAIVDELAALAASCR